MRLVAFTTITIIVLVFILPAILSFGVRILPQNDQPSLDKTQKIYENLIVSQSFISKTKNLSAVGVSLKNPNLSNKKDIVLSVYGEDGTLIRSITLNGKNIADGKFVKFKFNSIADSKNKQFIFTLTAPTTTKEEADSSNALEVFLSDQKQENISYFKIGDSEVLGNVAFVSFSKPPYPTYALESIYSKWLNKLTADWQFFTTYTVLIFTLVGLLLYQLARSPQDH